MSVFKTSIIMAIALSMTIVGCDRKGRSTKSGQQTQESPAPSDSKRGEQGDKSQTNQTAQGPAGGPAAGPTQTQEQQTSEAQNEQRGPTVREPSAPVLPAPSPSTPSQPTETPLDLGKLEERLPLATPLDTFGGQLISAYLSGQMTGEQVVAQTFDHDDLVMSTMAEMSLAIQELKEAGRYTPQDQQKVLVLEGAMTQFLNDKVQRDEEFRALMEYSTAVALGVLGGVYANEIIDGLTRLGQSPIMQAPMNGIRQVYAQLKGSPQAIANWLKRQVRQPENEPVMEVVQKSSEIYRKALGMMAAPGTREQRQQAVFQNIYRVINSPELAKGYRVTAVPPADIPQVEKLIFQRTGIPGFKINQTPGTDYLTAQVVARGGELEYYYVRGLGIKAVTKDGAEMVIPSDAMAGLVGSRLRNWGQKTVNFVTSTGRQIKTGVQNTNAYKYLSTDPFGRRVAQGVAVGAPITIGTLLALRPIDTSYFTLEDYVRDLEREGIKIDSFIDHERKKATSGRL